jgi:hypothetical protein
VIELAQEKGIPTYRAADVVAEKRLESIRHIKSYWDTMQIR